MTKSKKYLIWGAVTLIAFIAVICYASELQVWMMSKLTDILILIVVFIVGWLLGRFGGDRSRSRNEQNARDITKAQK